MHLSALLIAPRKHILLRTRNENRLHMDQQGWRVMVNPLNLLRPPALSSLSEDEPSYPVPDSRRALIQKHEDGVESLISDQYMLMPGRIPG